jgi:hypothetical protein
MIKIKIYHENTKTEEARNKKLDGLQIDHHRKIKISCYFLTIKFEKSFSCF